MFPPSFPFCRIAPDGNNSNLHFHSWVWKSSFLTLHLHHRCCDLWLANLANPVVLKWYILLILIFTCVSVLFACPWLPSFNDNCKILAKADQEMLGQTAEACVLLVGSSDLRLISPECQTAQWGLHANPFHKKKLKAVSVSCVFLSRLWNPGEAQALLEWARQLFFFFPCEESKTWNSEY